MHMIDNVHGLWGFSRKGSYVVVTVTVLTLLGVIAAQWLVIRNQSAFIETRLKQLDKEASTIEFVDTVNVNDDFFEDIPVIENR